MTNIKNTLLVAIAATGILSFTSSAHADAAAEQLLKGVRLGAVLQNAKLEGHMRKSGNKTPLTLTMQGENISFQFLKDNQWTGFGLQLKEGNAKLFETKNGKATPLPRNKIGAAIFNSDVTYEDLSLRFLYWKDATIIGEEKIKTQASTKIRLNNPGNDGQYKVVEIWVHKKSGALMQVAGYNKDGLLSKRFHVTKLMTVKGIQTLEKMNVETYKLGTKKVTGVTYLEFKDSTQLKPKGL